MPAVSLMPHRNGSFALLFHICLKYLFRVKFRLQLATRPEEEMLCNNTLVLNWYMLNPDPSTLMVC